MKTRTTIDDNRFYFTWCDRTLCLKLYIVLCSNIICSSSYKLYNLKMSHVTFEYPLFLEKKMMHRHRHCRTWTYRRPTRDLTRNTLIFRVKFYFSHRHHPRLRYKSWLFFILVILFRFHVFLLRVRNNAKTRRHFS